MHSKVVYRPVLGFPGYCVGTNGTVWSRLWSADGDWKLLKNTLNVISGHASVNLRRDGITHRRYVHHLVLEAFIGLCPEGEEARHFPDRDTSNNSLANLSWGTRLQNMRDKVFHGTQKFGDSHHAIKATRRLSKTIRSEYASGRSSQRSLAKKHGLAQMTINRIVRNQIGV